MAYPTSEPQWARESLQKFSPPFSPFKNGVRHFSRSSESLPFSKAEQPALELPLTLMANIPGVNGVSAGYNGQGMNLSDQFSSLNGTRTTLSCSPIYASQPAKGEESMQYLPQVSLPNGTDERNMSPYDLSYTWNQTQGTGFSGAEPPFRLVLPRLLVSLHSPNCEAELFFVTLSTSTQRMHIKFPST